MNPISKTNDPFVDIRPILEIENLSKMYKFNEDQKPEEIWALRDISFSVKRGESVGIIGNNGAGKTTLLKLISRITAPTRGRITIRARVAGLLEIGTGFHPELTGRENIFLNGAIHGMQRSEIQNKFHQIVDFSEVGKFIDEPVKHYSNGMQLRLAFSVAAHLDSEIILLDEILAVGDLGFQMKCYQKMQEISREGKTVLLVSHNMNLVERFCDRVLWIQQESLRSDGPAPEVIESYLLETAKEIPGINSEQVGNGFSGQIRILDKNRKEHPMVRMGEPAQIEIRVRGSVEMYKTCVMDILTSTGMLAMRADSRSLGHEMLKSGEEMKLNYKISEVRLMPGGYFLNLKIRGQSADGAEKMFQLETAFQVFASKGQNYDYGLKLGRRGVTYFPMALEVL